MNHKILHTERLLLRPWTKEDAESLYKYAKNPEIGIPAGWPPHKSIEESLEVIKNVFVGKECYAICEKENGKVRKYIVFMLLAGKNCKFFKWNLVCQEKLF